MAISAQPTQKSVDFRNISEQRREVNELLLDCLDEGLKEIFGKKGAQIILDYINRQHQLKSQEDIKKLEAFSVGLTEFLGSGAVVVEQKVLRILHTKLGE